MERLIKKLQNNRKVIFDSGKFDDWCVYVVESDGSKTAPLDTTYFTEFKIITTHYQNNKVYNDFVAIYNYTNSYVDIETTALIDALLITYNVQHRAIMEQWLTVIYAGMIAEENKQNAILKKRIKRLGMHQVLIDNIAPIVAANFSKGKPWRELDAIMRLKGF